MESAVDLLSPAVSVIQVDVTLEQHKAATTVEFCSVWLAKRKKIRANIYRREIYFYTWGLPWPVCQKPEYFCLILAEDNQGKTYGNKNKDL